MPSLARLFSSLRHRARTHDGWSHALGAAFLLGVTLWQLGPLFRHPERWGTHDWDMVTSFRFLTVKTLLSYHQFPFWNPYACGGFTSWGYPESGTNIVSPFLPFYLFLPLRFALRMECVGATLALVAGTWCLAGRFTGSAPARLLAAIVMLTNRWTMQMAVGHTMHLYYCLTPWILFFFDRALRGRTIGSADAPSERFVDAIYGAIAVALLVYVGAIYPLPQTVLLLGVYAVLLALVQRSLRPLAVAAVILAAGVGLAAPKLVPILATMRHHPRLVDSHETMGLGALVRLLTVRAQGLDQAAAEGLDWDWHEWGMYVGWPFVLAAVAALSFAHGPRERALKWVGVGLLLLAFGSFDDLSPWALLHELPIFRSQHVPSRWLYPTLLVFALLVASMLGRWLESIPRGRFRSLVLVTALGLVAWQGFWVVRVGRRAVGAAFKLELDPALEPETKSFVTEISVPPELNYREPDWAPPSLPGMIRNVGFIECWSVVSMSVYSRNPSGHVEGQGAFGRGDPNYKGEVYFASGPGGARIEEWSPNAVTVATNGATAGDTLVLNQNFDEGWSADGAAAIEVKEAVGTVVREGAQRVVFRYRPVGFVLGVAICLATCGLLAAGWRRLRRDPQGWVPRLVGWS